MTTSTTRATLGSHENIWETERAETKGNGLDKGLVFSIEKLDQFTVEPGEISSGEKVSPEKLYKIEWPTGVEPETPKILNLRQKIQASMDFLSDALNVEDEIERESVMNQFAESIFELAFFPKKSKNLKDAICLIQTAVEAQVKSIYDRRKILTLQKILALLKDNISMDDITLEKCFDLLEAAGFDVNAPLAEIEFAS